MNVSQIALPAGIGLAAICAVVAVGLVLRSRRSREQDKLSAEDRRALVTEQRESWRRGLAVVSLAVAFVIILCIAGIAAWLSFGAQRTYAFGRNGGSWSAATGFALLLDAGALGLSLMRLFEALTARSSQLTRLYLAGFVVASATMNLLHAPHTSGQTPSFGGRLVAVIPPLVYAIFLETLLKKVEQLVLGKYPKKKTKKATERGYSLLLWVPLVGYPWQMWRKWREDLHETLQYVRAPGSRKPVPDAVQQPPEPPAHAGKPENPVPPTPRAVEAPPAPSPASGAVNTAPEPRPVPVQQARVASPAPSPNAGPTDPIGVTPPVQTASPAAPQPPVQPPPAQQPIRGFASKSKKELLRDALIAQIENGDLSVLDPSAKVSNGAAYRANMQLGQTAGKGLKNGKQEGLLADGAVRTTVKQLLPELRKVAEEADRARRAAAAAPRPAPEPTPVHRASVDDGTTGDAPQGRQDEATPAIGHQSEAGTSAAEKEAAIA